MKKILIAVVTMCCGAAMAAPKFSEADQWRREMRKAVDENTKTMLSKEDWAKQGRRLAELRQRAEKLFGNAMDEPFGPCVKAITFFEAATSDQRANAVQATAQRVGGQSNQAFEAGVNYWACRTAIDELETKQAKR